MKVAVLCGGLATRLGALAEGRPKAMIEIGGRPYLERIVEAFANGGLREFVFLTGYRAEVIERHFGDGAAFGVSIEYSREPEPLGTGGALREARALLGERFVPTYGDVLRAYDYAGFVRRHAANALAVYPRLTVGNADVEDGRVVRFDKRAHELPYIDAGFSVIETAHLDLLPAAGAASFEEIVYAELARRGTLEAELVDRDFFDIGTPDELARTRAALEER
ncbi:MAG TPA: sugar phosphate nucleotidyltransferase [Thermoanaerobaculia bacterium]